MKNHILYSTIFLVLFVIACTRGTVGGKPWQEKSGRYYLPAVSASLIPPKEWKSIDEPSLEKLRETMSAQRLPGKFDTRIEAAFSGSSDESMVISSLLPKEKSYSPSSRNKDLREYLSELKKYIGDETNITEKFQSLGIFSLYSIQLATIDRFFMKFLVVHTAKPELEALIIDFSIPRNVYSSDTVAALSQCITSIQR